MAQKQIAQLGELLVNTGNEETKDFIRGMIWRKFDQIEIIYTDLEPLMQLKIKEFFNGVMREWKAPDEVKAEINKIWLHHQETFPQEGRSYPNADAEEMAIEKFKRERRKINSMASSVAMLQRELQELQEEVKEIKKQDKEIPVTLTDKLAEANSLHAFGVIATSHRRRHSIPSNESALKFLAQDIADIKEELEYNEKTLAHLVNRFNRDHPDLKYANIGGETYRDATDNFHLDVMNLCALPGACEAKFIMADTQKTDLPEAQAFYIQTACFGPFAMRPQYRESEKAFEHSEGKIKELFLKARIITAKQAEAFFRQPQRP